MTRLAIRIAVAALIALALPVAAVGPQPAAAATSAAAINTVPVRIVSFNWLVGQPQWRSPAAARLGRSVFQFENDGSFAMRPPGMAPIRGAFRVSGNTLRFAGEYRYSTYPSGETSITVTGTVNARTGVARLRYEAAQILVANVNGTGFNHRAQSAYSATVVLRRF